MADNRRSGSKSFGSGYWLCIFNNINGNLFREYCALGAF